MTDVRAARAGRDLAGCVLCIAFVWGLVILAGAASGGGPNAGRGLLLAYGLAAIVVLWASPGPKRVALEPVACVRFAAALGSGLLSFPIWAAGVASLCKLLGFAPPAFLPGDGANLALVLAIGCAGPLFEEVLYRGWLLAALLERMGWPGAVIASSAVFAWPHGAAWSVVTAFLLGLVLATSRRLGVGLGACIGAHCGLNLAFLLRDRLAMWEQPAWLAALGLLVWLGLLAGPGRAAR
jgi:membrane protease YdiL (CAAX protease family)